MGACSTIEITPAEALYAIVDAAATADNETLSEIMDRLFGGERPLLRSPRYCLNYFRVVNRRNEED